MSEWNYYPETEPDKSGTYLVCVRVWGTSNAVQTASFYKTGPERGWRTGDPMNWSDNPAYAWRELPEPCEYNG